jgi:hypothetical protein
MKINLNDRVKVTLSEKGREIHIFDFLDLEGSTVPLPNEPAIMEMLLWELINKFGRSMLYYPGADSPFVNNEIEIIDGGVV